MPRRSGRRPSRMPKPEGLGKFDPRHDARGKFATADRVGDDVRRPARAGADAQNFHLVRASRRAIRAKLGRDDPRQRQQFRGLEQKENICLTAYAGHGIFSYSGRSDGGDGAPSFLPLQTMPSFVRPLRRAPFAASIRSLNVRSRPVPAARQGRSRPAPGHRRRHGGDARPLGGDFRLRLEQALFREMVGGSRGGERRQVARRRPRHARLRRRRQADRHRLRR